MLIIEKELQHWIRNFYGYGSWNSKIWFIAYEESGGDLPEEVAARLNFFDANSPSDPSALCNIRGLYKQVPFSLDGPKADLFRNLYDYRFGKNAIVHGIWKNLIAFAHGYRDKKLPDLLTYQKNTFASTKPSEAFIQFYPLPSPHNHAWYYSWLDMPKVRFIRNRTQYQDHVYHDRVNTILQNIKAYKPEVVLMYDMSNINTLKKSIQESFSKAKFKMVQAIKLRIPQHHWADLEGTRILITTQTPALKHNRIETGFDWEELGKMARSGN